MNFIFQLAVKNLFRHRLRTFIVILAIAVAVMVVTFARGLITGMVQSLFENQISFRSGHIRVIDQEYQLKERLFSLNYTVNGFHGEGLAAMQESIEQIEGIKMTIPRIKFGAVANTEEELLPMLGWGVNPNKEIQFTKISDYITEGRMIEEGNREILVGKNLLEEMNRQIGDKITILYNNAYGSFKGFTFKIVGQIESPLPLLNNKVFYLPFQKAQQMLAMPDQATELLLITPDYQHMDSTLESLSMLFEQEDIQQKYSYLPWDKVDNIIKMFQIGITVYNFIYVFIILLASFVLINTMAMIINERVREIGMMSALGLRSRDILWLFFCEGSLVGVLGSFFGALAGAGITKLFSVVGINYTEAFGEASESTLMNPILYTQFDLKNIIISFLIGAVIVSITCIFPARRAARLEPVEALREI